MDNPGAVTQERYVLRKQLDLAFGRLPAILLLFPVVAALLWWPLRAYVSGATLVVWCSCILANAGLQLYLGRAYQRQPDPNLEQWAWIRIISATVNGVIWGGVLAVVFFVPEDLTLANFVVFAVGGTSVIALASTGTHRPSLFAFEVTNLSPMVVRLVLEGGTTYLAMAGLALGFMVAVLLIAQQVGQSSDGLIVAEASNNRLLGELRKAEAELREANVNLQRRVEERTTQLEQLMAEREAQREQLRRAERMEAVGRLAGGIAHDFNNVLTGIAGFASLVHDSFERGDERREDMGEILAAIARAEKLTKQLLGFAKGGITKPEVVEVGQHLRQLDKMLHRVLPNNVELCWQLPDGPMYLYLDPGQLDQLVMNLVVNARDAMPRGGTITVRCSQGNLAENAARCAIIRVTDTGTGISSDVINHIFEPFVSTKGDQGTGLGLATCFAIAQRAGGTIGVVSEVGHGATFEVRLPLSAVSSEPAARVSDEAGVRSGKGVKVLVVEDQPAILKMVTRALEVSGFDVYSAVSAEQALALVVTRGIHLDLVVSDVVLPHMSGVDLRDALRNHGCAAKFLLMSGYIDEASLRRKDSGEPVELLTKPFTARELLQTVSKILGPEARPEIVRQLTN